MNPADIDTVIQKVRFELYRENLEGALELLEVARAAHPDPRYREQAERILLGRKTRKLEFGSFFVAFSKS